MSSWANKFLVACLAAILGLSGLFGEDSLVAEREKEILVGTGDVAGCAGTGATSELLHQIPGTVFSVGGTTHDSGSREQFDHCYIANAGIAEGYSGDKGEGYYSYDLGGWHVVALNSSCEEVGGCDEDSPMLRWLEKDLAANKKPCTLAYWRHPLFSSGPGSNNLSMWAAWDALYVAGADVVVNGHERAYERFAPQTPEGNPDPERGIQEFVLGTGGREPGGIETDPSSESKPNSEVRGPAAPGVMQFTLLPGVYEWEFVPVEGNEFGDSGNGDCY